MNMAELYCIAAQGPFTFGHCENYVDSSSSCRIFEVICALARLPPDRGKTYLMQNKQPAANWRGKARTFPPAETCTIELKYMLHISTELVFLVIVFKTISSEICWFSRYYNKQ